MAGRAVTSHVIYFDSDSLFYTTEAFRICDFYLSSVYIFEQHGSGRNCLCEPVSAIENKRDTLPWTRLFKAGLT